MITRKSDKEFLGELFTRLRCGEVSSQFIDDTTNFSVIKIVRRRLSSVFVVQFSSADGKVNNFCVKRVKCIDTDRDRAVKKLQNEFDIHNRIFELCADKRLVSVVRPIAIFPDMQVIVTEVYGNSITLEDLLLRAMLFGRWGRSISEDLVAKCGRLLADFHQSTRLADFMFPVELSDLRGYVSLRLRLIDTYLKKYDIPDQGIDFQVFASKVDSQVDNRADNSSRVIVHGDFTPANVVKGIDVALIDFSESRESVIEADIACFMNYLMLLGLNKPYYSDKILSSLQNEFLAAYGSDKINSNLLDLYRLRYLCTNTLTQLYEMDSSNIKRVLFRRRIVRYLEEFRKLSKLMDERYVNVQLPA